MKNKINQNHKMILKKNILLNDLFNKKKKENPNLINNKNLSINKIDKDMMYTKIDPQLKEYSINYGKIDNIINNKLEKRDILNSNKKHFFTLPNYQNLKTATPKRSNFFKRNRSFRNINDSSFFNKWKSFYTLNTEGNGYVSDINTRKSFRKSNFSYYIQNKELINLNNILKEQNKDLRQNARKMKLKLQELLHYQNNLKEANQELLFDKKMLLMEKEQLENELDNNRNISLNELKIKNNKIKKLNEEMAKLKNLLAIKNTKIVNLINNNKYYESILNNNNYTDDYNSSGEIKELEFNEENKYEFNNHNNEILLKKNNELNKQINNLQLEKKNIILERQKKEQLFNQKINNLIKEKNKYINIISNLKKELMNSKISNQNENEKGNEIKDLQEKILLLQKENKSLKDDKIRIDKRLEGIINERNNLLKENEELKKIQNSLSLKLSTSYNNFIEESKQLKSQLNEKEKELNYFKYQVNNPQINDQISQENNNLKRKISELEKLTKNLIEANSKLEKEKLRLSNRIENRVSLGAEEKKINSEEDEFNNKINKENNEKENKLALENAKLKEKIKLIKIWQDEGLINTLENLKDELKDKEKQIQKLIGENQNLRSNISKQNINNINDFNNNEDEKEREIELEENPFRPTMNSQGLNDTDKVKLYKERIKEFQQINESDKMQIQELKKDIKNLSNQIKYYATFGGQFKDINEFFYLLNQVLINCKPQKKEQKDALEKILNIRNNFQSLNNNYDIK